MTASRKQACITSGRGRRIYFASRLGGIEFGDGLVELYLAATGRVPGALELGREVRDRAFCQILTLPDARDGLRSVEWRKDRERALSALLSSLRV